MAIDIGGTFTDTVLVNGRSQIIATAKTPTTPREPASGALEGAQRVLHDANASWDAITGMIHGTTLATNALIERRGARVATITNSGFRDILEIAYERRYSQYAINLVKPDLIVPRSRAFTIGGRIDAAGCERSPLDENGVDTLVEKLSAARVDAVAVCLLHAYANPGHELRLQDLLQDKLPGVVISLSHEVSPEAREFDRLCTTIANAYVQPLMDRYLRDFQSRFEEMGLTCPVLMMTAGGGMTTIDTATRLPIRLVESGPAGGALLAGRIAKEVNESNVLSFDMGGTTAKLCLIDKYRPQTARKFEISRAERFVKGSGMPVRIPVIEMIEIGAGGGSIASVDRLGRVQVGPQSAGSDPGPASFCKGGTRPTVTDADISQGYVEPSRFAEGRLTIDRDAAAMALNDHIGTPLGISEHHAGMAVHEMVNENMASAARMHAVESGKDLAERLMIAFGGNGPLHATRVARKAGVERILVPRDPGVGSAVGFLFAPVSFEIIRSLYATFESIEFASINDLFAEMARHAEAIVRAGVPEGDLTHRRVAFMRYRGQGHEIEIELPDRRLQQSDLPILRSAFEAEYSDQFSRTVPGMAIEILNWGLSVSSTAPAPEQRQPFEHSGTLPSSYTRNIRCDVSGEVVAAGVFDRFALKPGDRIVGPALVIEPQTTTLVSADFEALVDGNQNIWLTRASREGQIDG
ncbi:MAG: hydantoinase/oxoprolinase family protein [Rhizobiaceae bacterium]